MRVSRCYYSSTFAYFSSEGCCDVGRPVGRFSRQDVGCPVCKLLDSLTVCPPPSYQAPTCSCFLLFFFWTRARDMHSSATASGCHCSGTTRGPLTKVGVHGTATRHVYMGGE
ncbi:hypothetical protein VTO42DRAFT_104 [Malbranchea cinnamomea]